MKTLNSFQRRAEAGGALMLVMITTGVALAVLAGAMTWSANTTRQTYRTMQYTRSIAAAEGATEKVVSQMSADFLAGDYRLVNDNMAKYLKTVPKASDSVFWSQWQFSDAADVKNQTSVTLAQANKYKVLDSTYAGLRGFVSTYNVISLAREKDTLLPVAAGVSQEVQLARIPIFQFAMYSSGDMEISCGQPLAVTGRVHSNKKLYVEPDSVLTFQSDVTAVTDVLFQRHPDDHRGVPKGGVVYVLSPDMPKSGVPAMILPIGTTNTPEAIREIIQPPPVGESATSPMGRLRYYNQAELLIKVSDTGIVATSGYFNNFATTIPSTQAVMFVTITNNSFRDAREEKTVRPVDLNIGVLKAWAETNNNLRLALSSNILASVYVMDTRKLASTNLAAVRVVNGLALPSRGLTVATGRPLYVLGHFNQTKANLATTNTTTSKPASLVADAITILSVNWTDSKSTLAVGSRTALPTTVNAALLTGVVETVTDKYSGGMENFPRFLETWGLANTLTYNGSMVRMFPSLYATNAWGKSDVYAPPKRDWAFDLSFDDSTKLPPLTPSLVKVLRGSWSTVVANKDNKSTTP